MITNNPPATVYFDSSINRIYTLLSRTNLVEGFWDLVPGAEPRTGAGGADYMQDINALPEGSFYLMTVELP